ncbi:ATP synthase subunit I [Bacillus pseudomycoides]|jgi:ATP synthase protein I|uniref:ATP synthase subunit I n=1 Tax=Bacillus pseudomycoides TaxID=64104 RepID=A0A2B7GA14_9BACI|nr:MULTISPECIES: ATP synthase subunit I [Bacillus]AIK39039.1 ATP synthase I chain family protein [Bacillus pseudomycoides]AJI15990.1 ATP synthase I chain family protein [Bacillus pseudomycoides]KFN13845.1 ATP synthase I chain family protein [Bacillus pseudomycoides]MBJ8028077.1 ATP synthase subunit I [Bacillus cereus group sp. N21]MBO1581348.1 ATP synthase subunit I [Bacillus sp. XF8]
MISMSLRSFKIQMYYLLGAMLLGWAMTPFSAHFLGVGIGLLVSMYCVWILGRRIEKLGDSIVKKSKAPTLGMINRFAAAILGAIIMYEIEHHMVMWAFAVGIMGGYFLIVINLGYYSMKDAKK